LGSGVLSSFGSRDSLPTGCPSIFALAVDEKLAMSITPLNDLA
jgi:hypothetical protein